MNKEKNDTNAGDCNSGHRNAGDYNSGYRNAGYCNSGHHNAGDCNSGHHNAGHCNVGHHNAGDCNVGHWNSGHWNSGHYNSGHCNSGHCNSGFFNSDEPNIRMFNKDTKFKRKDLTIPFINLKLNRWVPEDDMTDQEKKDNPKFHITKGYLKTAPYKEAWKLYWKSASEEDKKRIKELPNFDSVVFYDITGIDVAVDTDKMKQEMIEEAEALLRKGTELLNKAKGIV